MNHHDYARAYHDILPRDRPPYAGFVQAYAATQAATLVKLTPATYLNVANGRAATCVGFALTAHNKNAPPTAFGGWYMMESTTGQSPHFAGWQIVESGTHSLLDGAATVPPQDTCFPPSTFVLPARGSATTIIALSSKDLPGPIKPMRRTEYDLAQSPFFYRVDVFNSLSDAASSYQWQAGTLSHLIPISHPATVGERLYQTGNFLIATLLSHNVEFFVNEQVTPNAQATPQDIASLLALAQRLSEEPRSRLSASATNPIPTPISTPESTPSPSDVPATPVPASPTVPSLTPAQQARNQQMATLEHQLATITQGCSDAVNSLDSDVQNIANGDTPTFAQDGQNGYYTCRAASVTLSSFHLSTALRSNRLVQQLLAEEQSFTAGGMFAGSLFNTSVEQNSSQIFYEANGELSGAEQHRAAAQALLSKIKKSFGI